MRGFVEWLARAVSREKRTHQGRYCAAGECLGHPSERGLWCARHNDAATAAKLARLRSWVR